MASKHRHGAFLICTTIAIVCALAEMMSRCSCYDHFDSMTESNDPPPHVILKNRIQSTMQQLSKTSLVFAVNGAVETLLKNSMPSNGLALSALESCRELLSLAMDTLNMSLSSGVQTIEEQNSVESWVCAAATHLQTCVDGFDDDDLDDEVRNLVSEELERLISLNRNSSTIMATITSYGRAKTVLLDEDSSARSRDHYPHWLTSKDRRLMQATTVTPNVVVAKDGSGNYTSISEAIKAAPRLRQSRYVIYVKKGSYHENVKVDINQWNVMIYGDGIDSSIIYSNRSYVGGSTTFDSATSSALGQGFIARDIRFMNTAGAINQQAVALLIAGDRSVCYRCRIDGYQDSLCVQSNRQFYRDCHIYGTVDFIFGGAAAVIQKSIIYVRKPLHGQENVISAHNRREPQCPTGIVVQYSVVRASEDITGVSTYLGRPWTPYATTVFMQNDLGQLIDPKGWFPWDNRPGAPPPPSTIFLAEYANRGNDAGIRNRVKWQGVRVNLTSAEASKFTVHSFIQGDQWIPATNEMYDNLDL